MYILHYACWGEITKLLLQLLGGAGGGSCRRPGNSLASSSDQRRLGPRWALLSGPSSEDWSEKEEDILRCSLPSRDSLREGWGSGESQAFWYIISVNCGRS